MEFDAIVRITRHRINERNPILRLMNEVKRRYNGDWVIPLPDLEKEPVLPPVTPFLVAQAVDNLGMRAGSVMPFWTFPQMNTSDAAKDRSRNRKRAWGAVCHKSYFHFVQRRAFNHLAGYAFCNLRVTPDFDMGLPRLLCEDPLSSFPEPRRPEDATPPSNCAYVYEMPAMQLRATFPQCRSEFGGPVGPEPRGFTELWTLVEWVDDDDCVIGIVGPKFPQEHYKSYDARVADVPWLELSRASNVAGRCPVVAPGKIGLDVIASQVANAIGLADFQARLMGLAVTAQEKAAWPDLYVIGNAGGPPRIVSGAWKDGRDGEANIIENASSVGVLRSAPDPALLQMINQLERNFKTSTNQNAAMVGETNLSMRSARGIDTSMSTSVDPLIFDMHKIVETYIPHLVDFTFATFEGVEAWNRKKFTIFSGWPSDKGMAEFTPSIDLVETHDMIAEYSIAGADVQQTTIGLGQLRATKAISQDYYRERHPWIGDSEAQERQVGLEDLEQAQFTGVLQMIASGQMDPKIARVVYEAWQTGANIFECMDHANKEAQRIQAMTPPAAPPGAQAPPEMMPGASAPAAPGGGQLALPPGSTNQGPLPDMVRQKQLLTALKANPGPPVPTGVAQ
jgi:hypothetical protein